MLNPGERVRGEAEELDGPTPSEEWTAGAQMKEAKSEPEEKALLLLAWFA